VALADAETVGAAVGVELPLTRNHLRYSERPSAAVAWSCRRPPPRARA
jgi:hypothetical protein